MIFADGGILLVLILNDFNTAMTWFSWKESSSVVVFHSQTDLMCGDWDSVKGLRAPQSLRFISEQVQCMENEIPQSPRVIGTPSEWQASWLVGCKKRCWSRASAPFFTIISTIWLSFRIVTKSKIFVNRGISFSTTWLSFRSAVKIYDFRWWRSPSGLRLNLVSSNLKWIQYCEDMIQSKAWELLSRCVPFPNKLNVWSSRFSQKPERFLSHFVAYLNKFNVWKTRFLVVALHRNDKLRGWWGVKKGAEAELQHLFLQ